MSCTRCQTPIEDGDLRCAICALPVPHAPGEAGATRVQILRCTNCNAAIAFDPEARAPKCGFCSSTMEIEQPVDPIEAARLRVPFTVDREAAAASLRRWLGERGWFAPKTLQSEAVLDGMVPLCWAAWIVHAQAAVAWTADSDDGAHRSRWAPHSGEVALRFDAICVPASRGLTASECGKLVPYYSLARAVSIDTDDAMQPMIESFDAQRSAARQYVQEAIEATAKTRVEAYIPGQRFRNVHVACLLEGQTTDRVALPAWVVAYRYRDKLHRAIVHGQRADIVVGRTPLDVVKLALVGLAGLVLAAIVAWFLVHRG